MSFYANYPPSASGGGSASTGPINTPIPGSATLIAGSDGTNLRPVSVDSTGKLNVNNISGTVSLPTGAATAAKQPALGTAGAPSVDVISVQGTASMTPLKVDASGTTVTVSGTVTANQGTANTATNGWPVKITDGTSVSAVKAASTAPVATDPALVVSMSPNSADPGIGPVSPGAAASKAYLVGGVFNTVLPTLTNTQQSAIQLDSSGRQLIGTIPAGANVIGKVSIDQTTPGTTNLVALAANQSVNLSQVAGATTQVGNGTAAGSLRVAIASDNTAFSVNAVQSGTWTVQPGNTANTTPWVVAETAAATSTCTNVASSVTSVVLLASNANRKHAAFFNDSTAVLYLKLGTTASNTSYTVQLIANAYYELPYGKIYSGEIDGIWATANGNCRVTELS